MTIKVAHISDVHWESRDDNVSDRLTAALKDEKPDFLVFTGDLVNNPWRVPSGKKWLLKLCTDCGIDPATRMFLVRGNHDVRVVGNFGFRPITGLLFRLCFWDWMRVKAVLLPASKLMFFCIESNPVMFGFARGRVGSWELRRLHKQWRQLIEPVRGIADDFTKIVLVHHHPVPILFEGGDFFLLLKDAQKLIQFLAEQDVHIVLHGHKHRAPYSLLSLGTCGGSDRFIEVLGAGAVVKSNDHDPRGHNFNLICIENSGLRYVRQFFAPPGEPFREIPSEGFLSHTCEQTYRRARSIGHKYMSIRWSMDIDVEGDRFNQLSYQGLAVTDSIKELPYIEPPPYKLDTGHLSGVEVNVERSTPGVTREIRPPHERRLLNFRVNFPFTPTEQKPIHFTLESYDLNASSMNLTEFKRKFPRRPISREWDQKLIRVPVDHFSWTIRFPHELVFDPQRPPEFEVWDDSTKTRHEWLTRVMQPCFSFSEALNTVFLSIHKPPVGYLYRIYWYISERADDAAVHDGAQAIVTKKFSKALLKLAKERKAGHPLPPLLAQMTEALKWFGTKVKTYIEDRAHEPDLVVPDEIDISLMVYEGSSPDMPPQLRIVACTATADERFWEFGLEIGDGNAGRAYKNNVVRCYDRTADDPKEKTYVFIPGQPPHECLYSIPLQNPDAPDLIFGVLNLGTFSAEQAVLLKSLNDENAILWLLEIAHDQLLPKFREIAKLVKD
jgi:predicted phosphodiesterase